MRSTKELIEWLKEIAEVNGIESFAEAAEHVQQLQADLEAIMQQRDNYRHQATALNLLNEQLEERCEELEQERSEVARKAFVAGANWWAKCELDDTLHSDEHEAASEYAQREYVFHFKQ